MPTNISDYLGDSSYTHISDFFEQDYNLDGVISEEESLQSYEEMLEWFGEDHIITLTQDDVIDMDWCICDDMSEEYIDAAVYAIEYYDDNVAWVNTTWVITESDCSSYKFSYN
jgi:hypothetical protein